MKVKNKDELNFSKFKQIISKLQTRKLKFDKKFESKEDDHFYCSELVYYIIKNSNREIKIDIVKKKLTGIDAVLLKRDTITYYPTDIFLSDKNFEVLKRW